MVCIYPLGRAINPYPSYQHPHLSFKGKKNIIHWRGVGNLSAGFIFSSTKEAACIHPLMQLPYRCLCVCWRVSDSFAMPWTVAPQAPLSVGFPRQEYWSRLPFPSPGYSPSQGSDLCFLHCRWILYHRATREAHFCMFIYIIICLRIVLWFIFSFFT